MLPFPASTNKTYRNKIQSKQRTENNKKQLLQHRTVNPNTKTSALQRIQTETTQTKCNDLKLVHIWINGINAYLLLLSLLFIRLACWALDFSAEQKVDHNWNFYIFFLFAVAAFKFMEVDGKLFLTDNDRNEQKNKIKMPKKLLWCVMSCSNFM